jgi:hypothetical protein
MPSAFMLSVFMLNVVAPLNTSAALSPTFNKEKKYEGVLSAKYLVPRLLVEKHFIIKRVSWFKSSLLLRIKTVDITNINS